MNKLQLHYTNDNVKKLFTDFSLMQKKIGSEKTKTIKKRVDALKAADNFSIFLKTCLGNPESLSGNWQGYYSVRITANYRLIIKPLSKSLSAEALAECKEVEIKGVDDPHGSKDNFIIS